MILREHRCPICGSSDFSFFETMEGNVVVRCGKCGKLWCVAPEEWQEAIKAHQEVMGRVKSEKSQ